MKDDHAGQRHVAGMWCGDVLDLLPQFVDGTLSSDDLARVRAHLSGCDWCETFGGAYGSVVTALKRAGTAPPEGLAERLKERLNTRRDAE